MIENMRKYQGLMLVILALLAVGLVLTMGNFTANAGKRAKVAEAYGESIDQLKFRKLGENSLRVISETGDFRLLSFARDLGAYSVIINRSADIDELIQFVTNRIVVKTEAAKLGIYPSEQQALEYIQNEMFQSQEGSFDKKRYDEFIQNIGKAGFKNKDFVQLISEFNVYNKLREMITSGAQENTAETEKITLFNNQTVDTSVIELDVEKFKNAITLSEDEIKEYWQLNEGKYQTLRELKISYVLVKPDFNTPEPAPAQRAPGMSDEDYDKLNKDYQEALAKWNIEKKKAVNKVGGLVDDLSLEIEENEGKDFIKILKENGFTTVTTELFNKDTAPEALITNRTAKGESILDALISQDFGTSTIYQIKDPFKTLEDAWFYCKFEEEKAPEPKTFELAKELAKVDLLAERSKTAMNDSAESLKAKLSEAIKAGKTLSEAASAEGLLATRQDKLTAPNRGSAPKDQATFRYASLAEPQSFSKDTIDLGDTIALVYLHDRKVIKTPETVAAINQAKSNSGAALGNQLFGAWLRQAIEEANIQFAQN